MPPQRRPERAAIGFTVKSGWAATVLLAGPPRTPRVLDSRKLDLSDPAVPEARQPYHAGFGSARRSGPGPGGLVASVERFGHRSTADVIREYRQRRPDIVGVGMVAGSLIDPDRIGNSHIRIHALEGRLFREIILGAAQQSGLSCTIWLERDLLERAARALRLPGRQLRIVLTALGTGVAGPWRVEQKLAAAAAWLVLASRKRPAVG